MAAVIQHSKLLIDSVAKCGQYQIPLDKVIGGETPYPPSGVSVGKVIVPASKKWAIQTFCLRAESGYRSVEIGAGPLNGGVLKIATNGTQRWEARLHCHSNSYLSGADELAVTLKPHTHQFTFQDGIVLTSGQAVLVTLSPAYNTPLIVRFTMTGTTAGALDIRQGKVVLATTTADQTVLSFTPSGDYTLLSINFDAIFAGQLAGQGHAEINGCSVFETPYLGLGETSCNALDDKGQSGAGMGGIFFPLWGIEFYPGDNFDFMCHAHCEGNQYFTMDIWGNDSDLTTGGGGEVSHVF